MAQNDSEPKLRDILAQTVFARGTTIPFGELTAEDVRARADELRAATGWGPTVRVAPVALAWRELAVAIERDAAGAVRDLDAEVLLQLAPRLWIVPPGGSLL